MPDHLHLLWLGLGPASDQDKAAAFFRRYLNAALRSGGFEFQKQPWDVVLGEREREFGAVLKTAFYVAENPVRAGLVREAREWPFSGSQAAGYPQLDWREPDYREKVWRIYEAEVRRRQPQPNSPGMLTHSAPGAGFGSGSGIGNDSGGEARISASERNR